MAAKTGNELRREIGREAAEWKKREAIMKVKVAKVKVKVETKLKDVEVWEMNYKEKLVLIKGKAKLETEGNIEQM